MSRLASLVAAALLILAGCGGSDKRPDNAARHVSAIQPQPEAPELASNEGQIIVDDHAIIRQGAVGPLRVGEWRRPVMSFVYVVSARAGRDSTAIIVVRGIGKDTVTLTFSDDTLRKILVTRPGARTADGLEVGTPFATVADRADAITVTRGNSRVAALSRLCGVKFATDSSALGEDSVVTRPYGGAATVRAISIEMCKR
ncbi:MAG: hypothetical protein ABI311_14565 [Gemmatimonadaceae bacterium]